MENGFLFPSENLKYLIGFLLSSENNIIIVSPWITEFKVHFPINSVGISEMTLSNALNYFSKSKKIKVIVSLTEEKYTQIFLNNLTENVNVQKVENLHAKLIVTDNFVYLGSANITKTGTSINKEICKLEKNTSESAERFLK